MDKVVSVIIPCYNGEHFIDRAISSVYSQDYNNIELIVVDDGSTDGSKEKIIKWKDRFEAKGVSLVYVYQKNAGSGGAIDTGLKHITGDYLSLLDADDEYLPGAISKRVNYLENHPECDAVRANGWVVCGEHKHLFVYEEAEKQIDDVFLALLRGETNNWAGSYLLRTKALFEFYPDRSIYKSRYGQNLQLLLPLVYKKKCGFIDAPVMNYIRQDNSLSRTDSVENAKDFSVNNAKGYNDIRINMLSLIVKDREEYNYYLKKLKASYWRNMMRIAFQYDDKELLKGSYSNLKKYEKVIYSDKVMYYSKTFPIISIMLRIAHKISSVFSKA